MPQRKLQDAGPGAPRDLKYMMDHAQSPTVRRRAGDRKDGGNQLEVMRPLPTVQVILLVLDHQHIAALPQIGLSPRKASPFSSETERQRTSAILLSPRRAYGLNE